MMTVKILLENRAEQDVVQYNHLLKKQAQKKYIKIIMAVIK